MASGQGKRLTSGHNNLAVRMRMVPHWVRAQSSYRKRDYEGAIQSLSRMAEIGHLKSYHLAFFGLNYFMARKENVAKNFFEKAKPLARMNENNDGSYISTFCDYFLVMINEEGSIVDQLETAAQIECSRVMKRWLPLPSPQEYRKWMSDHPE